MLLVVFCGVALSAVSLLLRFYVKLSHEIIGELKNHALLLERSLNLEDDQRGYLEALKLSGGAQRVTLVAPDGMVLYDNAADAAAMENHADREEIAAAIEHGAGESRRSSATLGEETHYYALRLTNGNVLRVSKSAASIYGVIADTLPQSVLILLIIFGACLFFARKLTQRIVKPLNQIDFSKNAAVYDELSPFLRTIEKRESFPDRLRGRAV